MAEQFGVRTAVGARDFLFSIKSSPVLHPTQSLVQYSTMGTGDSTEGKPAQAWG